VAISFRTNAFDVILAFVQHIALKFNGGCAILQPKDDFSPKIARVAMAAGSTLRSFCIALAVLGLGLPMTGVASAQAPAAAISGTITDTSGERVGGADVTLEGPSTVKTQSSSDGTFAFPSVTPGIYRITVRRGAFSTLQRAGIVVNPSTPVTLALTLVPVSFSSIQTIGSTSSTVAGPGTVQINTSTAAVSSVSNAQMAEQDPHQVNQILNEIPGIITTVSGNNTNIAAGVLSTPQIPQIRGALPYETESLIDGHPVSVGYTGSFSPLFVNPNQLQSIEVVKGPGAQGVDINYAVGGSVNYITLQPTIKPHEMLEFDVDSYGGQTSNLQATGTVLNGKLGYAVALGIDGTPGPLNNYLAPGTPTEVANGANATINGVPYCGLASLGTSCFQTSGPGPGPANLLGLPSFNIQTYACCAALQSQYLARTELGKIRYNFSQSTSFTLAYLGGQSNAAFAQTFAYPAIMFVAPPGYTGSVPSPTSVPLAFDTYAPYTLQTTQGLLESELRTSLGNNSLLVRYYTGVNDSNDYNVPFDSPYVIHTNLWGGTPNAAGTGYNYYNDTPATILVDGAGTAEPQTDHYDGISGEFDVPQGNNLYTVSFDRTRHSSFFEELYAQSSQDTTIIPAGSSQAFTTFMLRGQFALGSKVNLNIANYFINYRTHYTPDGGASWSDASNDVYAPRLAFTDRMSANSVLRLSAGTSIAPPYLALVTTQAGAPQPNVEGNPSFYTEVENTGKITPESAFGYDLGFDQRVARDTAVSFDAYWTQLHGQFLTSTSADGTYTGTSGVNEGITAPLFVEQTENLGSSRYEGLELSVYRAPALGFGYRVQGSLLRAFAYDLPPGFYDTAAGPNTTNLGVIPNINFQTSGLTYNGLSNGRIPYSLGYAELNYRSRRSYVLIGMQYYGSNNQFNLPAFATVNASYRYNITPTTSLQLTGNNLTSAYSTTIGLLEGGIPVPLAGGLLGATPQITIGPSNFRFAIRQQF
jgi:hypothetical protein